MNSSRKKPCEHPCLVPIGTQRIKICVDCCAKFDWNLDKDQPSKYGDTDEKSQQDYLHTTLDPHKTTS